MSWSPRDYKQSPQAGGPSTPPPQQTFDDSQPLPTFMAGMDDWGEDAPQSLPLWQRQSMAQMGVLTPGQWEQWVRMVKRGVTEV